MSRSSWKSPNLLPNVLSISQDEKQKYITKNFNKENNLFIFARSIIITPFLIQKTCFVWNGNRFVSTLITEDMVGFKLGEFSPTRKKPIHKVKKKIKK